MRTSQNITVTDSRTRNAMDNFVKQSITPVIQQEVKSAIDDEKIKTGKVTKFYPYWDKAEVKLDKTKTKLLCKTLHRFGGNLIDFFTPLGERQYDNKRKEVCIVPRDPLHALIIDVSDNTKDYLILGYYYPREIVGIKPAKVGSMRITSLGASKENYIEFSGRGLKIQTSKPVNREYGEFEDDITEDKHADSNNVYTKEEVYTKQEVDELIAAKIAEALGDSNDNTP